MSDARTAVIGLGHALLGDDALGVAVVHALERDYAIPDSLVVVDAGSCGLDLSGYLLDHEQLIFVDALLEASPPGTVSTLGYQQLMAASASAPRFATHQPALQDALALVNLAGRGPREALLVGIVPDVMEVGVELSPSGRAAVPRALDEVLRHLDRFGIRLERRRQAERATG